MNSYKIKPIKSQNDYEKSLQSIEELIVIDPEPGSEESDLLNVLAVLVENYEKTSFPLDLPTAIDAIKFRMEQLDLRPVDLVPYLGSASRVSEILSGKRRLTIKMINALSAGLDIPVKALLNIDRYKDAFTYRKSRSSINQDAGIIVSEATVKYK